MTTIAWDGERLAGDKRSVSHGLVSTVTKIFKDKNGLYGISGNLPYSLAVLNWIQNGADPATYPEKPSADDYAYVLHIRLNGEMWLYENCKFPFQIEQRTYAIGSGRDFAITAMHLGHSATSAVQIATFFDNGTGNGINSFTLEDCRES